MKRLSNSSRLTKTKSVSAVLLGFLLGTLLSATAIEDSVQTLAEDEQLLFPDLQAAEGISENVADLFDGATKEFKVVRITPLQGNNFLNQQQPLLNFDGRIVRDTNELRELINGINNVNNGGGVVAGGGGAFSGCLGFFSSGLVALEEAALSLNINTAAQTCSVSPNTNGNIDFFFPVVDGGVLLQLSVLTAPFNLESVVPPSIGPGGAGPQDFEAAFGNLTVVLNQGGVRIRITFTLAFVSGAIINGGANIVNPAFSINITSINIL